MHRPPSIIWFERLFWASMIVGLISTAFAWADMQSTLEKSGSPFGMTSVAVTLAVFLAIPVAFWYAIARRGSNVVRWIYVIWMGFGVIMTLLSLFDPQNVNGIALGISLISTALSAASIACLFRGDAVAWLTGKAPVDPGIFS
ncbi:hypothetical protein BWQ93_07430 [Sphingopyxis sp. QXT-31]|uniref:hypothetical protein n=1 Tax=Sphingopyxis sp. QXT-31 TaxID=1357916 RepID=UPI0009793498|nr:hypothetical protein [Sphingopyxis sp. QXT-31]APZ98335.1 hypothetical protein BWQ93_07430 [Sphingopyxis sp. QXT-31]